MKAIRICFADFADKVFFILETLGQTPGCFVRNPHAFGDCFVARIRSFYSSFMLHQVNDEHRFTMSERIRLEAVVIFQEESADLHMAVAFQFRGPLFCKRIFARFNIHG
jgi:hypothetical protein